MLGDKIKRLRIEKRLTQQELADALGLGQSTIGMIESGKRTIGSKETLLKLANFFNVSLDYLLADEGSLNVDESNLTLKDEKDIAKDVKNIIAKITSKEDGPIYYEGNELNDDDLDLFKDTLEFALKRIKIKNKEKYTPKKYKK